MKMAISIPNALYEDAEKTALFMGIPQNRLFELALKEFLDRHDGQMITQKINDVYEKIDTREFDRYLNAGLEPTRDLTKNDAW